MAEPQASTLGPEDFAALNEMSVASMAGRTQANALIGKMTPAEKQSFYTYVNQQPHGTQATRTDSGIASGVPGLGTVNAEDVMGAGMLGRAAVGAMSVPGIARKAVAVLGEAAPILKYEVAKATLEKIGVPAPIAMVTAMAVSGYRGNGKKAATEAAAEAPAVTTAANAETPLELTRRVKAEYRAANPAATAPETVSGGTPPPAGPPPVEAPGGSRPNGYPDQKALNQEAIARRRAEYQARTTEAATPPQPPAPKPTMSAEESKAYLEMRVAGKTDAQAKQAIEASRALNQSLNLKTPTAAEKRFPKGNRGKTTPE